jgi:hypothetical protein
MRQINDNEDLHLLREAGFTALESNRLIQLRREYRMGKLDQNTHQKNPLLQFGRWCVRIVLTEEVCYALSHPHFAEQQEEGKHA